MLGQRHRGMASVGKTRPLMGRNFALKPISLILKAIFYGKTIEVFWLDYIRDMIKFNNIDELCAQLEADKKIAEKF